MGDTVVEFNGSTYVQREQSGRNGRGHGHITQLIVANMLGNPHVRWAENEECGVLESNNETASMVFEGLVNKINMTTCVHVGENDKGLEIPVEAECRGVLVEFETERGTTVSFFLNACAAHFVMSALTAMMHGQAPDPTLIINTDTFGDAVPSTPGTNDGGRDIGRIREEV